MWNYPVLAWTGTIKCCYNPVSMEWYDAVGWNTVKGLTFIRQHRMIRFKPIHLRLPPLSASPLSFHLYFCVQWSFCNEQKQWVRQTHEAFVWVTHCVRHCFLITTQKREGERCFLFLFLCFEREAGGEKASCMKVTAIISDLVTRVWCLILRQKCQRGVEKKAKTQTAGWSCGSYVQAFIFILIYQNHIKLNSITLRTVD